MRKIGTKAIAAVVVGILGAALALAAAGPAQAKKRPGQHDRTAKVALKVATKNQRALLKRNVLIVRVAKRGRVAVRISARVGKHRRLFRPRLVRFRGRGKRTVRIRLRLTRPGRKRLATCGAKRVVVVGRYRTKVRRHHRRAAARDRRRLPGARSLCRKPPVRPKQSVCDPLDPAICLQPFPNDFYTKADPSTPTGLRLDYPPAGMPANKAGVQVDPAPINRSDGFSPGSLIVTKIPGVETPAAFENTGFVPETDMRQYARPDQPVVVYDTTTNQRWPIWAELDSNPTSIAPYQAADGIGGINLNPSNTGPVNLIVRPARNFIPGHRYVVAFRNLKDAKGKPVEARHPFRVCRDRLRTRNPALRYRCIQLNRNVFPELAENGISRDGLYLAWGFTVASQENLTGRALQIRDDAFGRRGDTRLADRSLGESESPKVKVTHACGGGFTDCSSNDGADGLPPLPDENVYRYVDGFIEDVPCYLNRDGCPPGSFFDFNPDGSVRFNPAFTTDVPFRCLIPNSANDGGVAVPGRVGIFGHGVLGSYAQIWAQARLANHTGQTWCATNWAGFSSEDLVPGLMPAMSDLSNFHKLVDRMQQGFVNFMMLGRAAIHPEGMATQPEFRIGGDSVIDVSRGKHTRLLYMGISQGSVMGAALTALEPDVDYGVLAVPGVNYSTLLRRSIDFDQYAAIPNIGLWANYPDEAIRPLGLGMIQLLWDRGEGNGYAANLRAGNELPDTPPHQVLMMTAVGDPQVPTVASDVEARTIGAKLYSPAVHPGRHADVNPFMGIPEAVPPIENGNVTIYFDGGPPSFFGTLGQGTKVNPPFNVPGRAEWGFGGDSHYYPWQSQDGIIQASSFLKGHGVTVCQSGDYCYSNGWTGP